MAEEEKVIAEGEGSERQALEDEVVSEAAGEKRTNSEAKVKREVKKVVAKLKKD